MTQPPFYVDNDGVCTKYPIGSNNGIQFYRLKDSGDIVIQIFDCDSKDYRIMKSRITSDDLMFLLNLWGHI